MRSKKPSPAELRQAFETDLASCWQYGRSLHPKETPYAFALHGLEGTPEFYPHVLTEESLTRVAKRYVAEGYHESLDEARRDLRYSMEDSPYTSELEDKLPSVSTLMNPVLGSLDETEGYALLAKAAMDAFITLDKQGLFGKGKQRDRLVLIIDTSLAEKDWSLPSVKRLNPKTVLKRYEAQTRVEGDYVSATDLSFSANGKLLCYEGYREVDPRAGKTYRELVVCDLKELKTERRWCFSSKREGGFYGISCGCDGTVFTSDVEESGDTYETTLVRYANGDKARRIQVVLPGEAFDLTTSLRGDRVALCLNDKLLFLNEKLQTVTTVRAPKEVRLQQFLKSGELLAVVNKGILKIDARGKTRRLPYNGDVLWASLDAAESLCAVSFMKDEEIQHGFKLLRFPKMKLLREFKIPGHQLTRATLSSDGKLVACEAKQCGKYQKFILVYDVKTGREVTRLNAKDIDDFAFLPGKSVLAMGCSGHMKKEPLIFLKIP